MGNRLRSGGWAQEKNYFDILFCVAPLPLAIVVTDEEAVVLRDIYPLLRAFLLIEVYSLT